MRSRPALLLVLSAIALITCVWAVPSSAVVKKGDALRRSAQPKFVPGEALVRFEKGTSAAKRSSARGRANVAFKQSTQISQAQVVKVKGSVRDAVARLEAQPDVAFAQPNYIYHALAAPPNDTRFPELWGLNNTGQTIEGAAGLSGVDVNALSAWDNNRGDGVVIAIADSGVDRFHPDVAPNLIAGFDFIAGDSSADDFEFHGTHVAGTAAAVDGNNSGVAGVAPNAKIMPVRVLDGDGSGSSQAIGNGIAFAGQNGADVINLSLGGANATDPFMSAGVDVANARDAVVVAAAGNDSTNNDGGFPQVPCNLPQPNILCVASLDNNGALSDFSNFGTTSVDVGAPGGSILSAKTDFDNFLANPGFEAGPALTSWNTAGVPTWGTTTAAGFFASGVRSATDSPGGNYPNNANGLLTSNPVSFAGRVGCRLDLMARIDTEEDFDFFDHFAESGGSGGTEVPAFDDRGLTGTSGGFFPVETSLEPFDGDASVTANFQILSDPGVVDDGAYVDDVFLGCRPASAATEGNAYHYFDGTSMASPHVAGVVALVRRGDPGAPDTQVVQAVKESVDPISSLSGMTVTGGLVNAAAAINRAVQLPNPVPVVPPPAPTAPGKARFIGSKKTIRVKKGRFTYRFRGGAGLRGSATFKSIKKVKVSKRKRVTLAKKSFRVPASGKVALKIKLSKKNLRILRRNRKIKLRVTVKLRNAAGLSSTATRRLTLKI